MKASILYLKNEYMMYFVMYIYASNNLLFHIYACWQGISICAKDFEGGYRIVIFLGFLPISWINVSTLVSSQKPRWSHALTEMYYERSRVMNDSILVLF